LVAVAKKEGSIRNADFASFIERLPFDASTTLVMDNASIHKTKLVKEAVDRKKYNAVYTAPYRPDWNPVEHVFSPFKHHFRNLCTAPMSIEEKIQHVWATLPSTLWENSFVAVERRYKENLWRCGIYKDSAC
jgi:transposase